MGRIFKTPSDNATEETLRALHTQNTLDTYYERGWGWLRTLVFVFVAILATSYWEKVTDTSVWDNTVQWFFDKLRNAANWILGRD